ncbi:MAG: fibronectin type III-like domain-contianing protein [Acidobacteriota bacterium]
MVEAAAKANPRCVVALVGGSVFSVVTPDGQLAVTVDVTNTGTRRGEEIVQLYVGFEGSKVDRPVKLLRAFDKIALGPGETKTVALAVDVGDLAWYSSETSTWEIEPMTYSVLVGPSSRAADLLKARFTVKGVE